jgi:iodotyrosine deiodinase
MSEQLKKSSALLLKLMQSRHSVRMFSTKEIPIEVIKDCIAIAGTAPSGANMQPWSFVLVRNKKMKTAIREEAERVEQEFYDTKITPEWREQLRPLGTDSNKPFLTDAPYLICIFVQKYGIKSDQQQVKHYYPSESAGIATGFLLSALHQLGISTLTYTPAPMNFIAKLLNRPRNERPYLIIAAGYAHEKYSPPDMEKKKLKDILTVI